ncbi:MAG: hypothetical protein CME70_10040 [Halobacteriovorax sp.]|nr:hypothetical protein [Halobacteriovorax sp.]
MRFLLLAFFLLGCASNEDKVFVDQVSPDLVETFKIENEKFKKFVIVNKKPDKEKPLVKKSGTTKKESKSNQEKPQPVLKITKKKDVIEIPEAPDEAPEKTDVKKKAEYPEDYPEELKKIDRESEKTWKNYTPFYRIGEEFVFAINYLGITAGHVRFITNGGLKIAGRDALHFRALFKTSKFYKYIYEADDMVETYVSADKFLPIKYSLVQRESNKDVDDLQLFDHEEKKTYMFYKRFKKKNNQLTKKEKEAFLTKYFQDFMSTLFFVRGLPLKKGDVYKFPVYTRGKFWRLDVKVASVKDNIKVMGKWRDAIRLDTIAHPPKSDKKKSKSTISFWYSNDSERIFLKLEAKLKFGAVEGEIEEHIPGRRP